MFSLRYHFRGRYRRSDTLEKVYRGAKNVRNKKKGPPGAGSSRCFSRPCVSDDELWGCSDNDFAPIHLMDEGHKEALLDNEDGKDEGCAGPEAWRKLLREGFSDVRGPFRTQNPPKYKRASA